ncbi:MAG: InlB B-repeat-containing protein [Sedimentibacter sp.]|nr:InlB B-repeat-containing protein [Sedimentibacter sp.]
MTRIWSNSSSFEIKFESDPSNYGEQYQRVLKNIEVFYNNILFKGFYFEYIRNTQRFFLSNITIKGEEVRGEQKIEYKFDYNDPLGLPDRFSFDQDHLGYYNNKNNVTFLPKNYNFYFSSLNDVLADREPDFNYSSKGTLSTIHYPTGGFTHFEYEAPPTKVLDQEIIPLNVYFQNDNLDPNTKLKDSHLLRSLEDDAGNMGITCDQIIKLNINVQAEGQLNNHYKVLVKFTNKSNNTFTEKNFVLAPDIYEYDRIFEFDAFKGNVYEILLELIPNPESEIHNATVTVNANFSFIKGYTNGEGLGIRIKRTYDKSSPDAEPVITRYYYKKASNINAKFEDPTLGTNWGSYIKNRQVVICCVHELPTILLLPYDLPSFPVSTTYYLTCLQSNTINPIFPTNDCAWLYKDVTISYGGDDFENGGIQKSFLITDPVYPRLQVGFEEDSRNFEIERDNLDMYNPLLVQENVIKKENDKLYFVKSIEYKYEGKKWMLLKNYILKRMYNVCGTESNISTITGLYLGLYNLYSKTLQVDSVITTEYTTLAPIDYFQTNIQKITSIKTYDYDTYIGLPSLITNTNSNSDELYKTYFKYPSHGLNLNNLNSTDLNCYSNLYYRNIISSPVQKENYLFNKNSMLDSVKISTERSLYNSLGLVRSIMNSFGNNELEDNVVYHSYNSREFPTELSKKDGIRISYLWGYNNEYPVAKITNASLSSVFYESFEDIVLYDRWNSSGSGNKDLTHNNSWTGNNCLKFSGTTTAWSGVSSKDLLNVTPGKTYVLSCWYKALPGKYAFVNLYDASNNKSHTLMKEGSGEWEYLELKVTASEADPNPCTVVRIYLYGHESSGADLYYDDIRFYPEESQMETFTYKPGIGITSHSDANSIPTFYVYDGLGRLSKVRDHEGNILKQYDYHYAGQKVMDDVFGWCQVEFNTQGGSAVSSVSTNYNTTISTPTAPTRTGYTFVGWYKESACTNAWNFSTDKVIANTTLYAKWTANTYAIVYNLNGGTNSGSNPATYTYGVGVTLSSPTRTGYAFGGWYRESTFTTAITAISTTSTGTVTLYAKWTANTYAITYNLNGGTNSGSNPATYTYGVGVTLSSPTRTGYTFGGWYKESTFNTAVAAISATSTGTVTLYAKWTANTYAITYNLNGGTNSGSNPATYTYGVGVTLSSPTRTGYAFGGWYKEPTFNTAVAAISTTSTGTVTLYAKWTINTYTVTFNSQGGSAVSSVSTNYSTTIAAPTAPTRTGYTFGGWYKEAACTNVWNFTTNAVTSNITLYAKWTLNSYTIFLTVIKGTGGFVTPSGNSTVFYGNDLTYNITPYDGYKVKDVKVNGVSVGAVTTYSFLDVTSNKTISVEFEALYINVDNSPLGISLSGGSINLIVSSNTAWTISSNVSWCTISPTSGSGNATVMVTCAKAYKGTRSGILTLNGGGVTLNVTITQSDTLM